VASLKVSSSVSKLLYSTENARQLLLRSFSFSANSSPHKADCPTTAVFDFHDSTPVHTINFHAGPLEVAMDAIKKF
jgi:hypothetical protein